MSDAVLNNEKLNKKKVSDSLAIVLSVCSILSVNNVIYNVLFIILGSAAELKGYTAKEIGLLGTAYLLGQVFANFSSVLWVRKLNWKWVIGCSTLVSILSLYFSSFANYYQFLVLLTITGLASGTALACVMCCISGLKDPTRAYSFGLILQVFFAGAAIYALQVYVTPSFGYAGLLYTIAGLYAFSFLFLSYMPSTDNRGKEKAANKASTIQANGKVSIPSIVALLGIACYFIGQTGIWGFLERIAVSKNMDNEFIGIVLGAVLVLCSLGAIAAMKVGNSMGQLRPMVIGIVLFCLSIILWVVTDNKWIYSISALLYASVWNFVLPYQLMAVSKLDKDGRYVAMIPAFQSLGGAAGPAIIGVLVIGNNFNYAYLFAIFTTLLSFSFFWFVNKKHQQQSLNKSSIEGAVKSEPERISISTN